MELYCWPVLSRWGLPSLDIESLQVLTYIKLTGATNITVQQTQHTWFNKSARCLPCLNTTGLHDVDTDDNSDAADYIYGCENIIQHLNTCDLNLDLRLDVVQHNNVLPLTALVMEKLYPAVLATLWLDAANFKGVTVGMYAKSCRYPFNFVMPHHLHDKAKRFVKEFKRIGVMGEDGGGQHVEPLQCDGASMLNMLSEYLGDKDYFFGKTPSSLDALLFSMLLPVLKLPLVNKKLQNHLRACPNLCEYVTRIYQKCFPDMIESYTADHAVETERHEWMYDWLFPLTVASMAMVSYAANAGLLHVKS